METFSVPGPVAHGLVPPPPPHAVARARDTHLTE